MRPDVLRVWHAFSSPMEGEVNHFYADVKGLITIGVGNLVDPVAAAVHLPMRRQDGTLASRDEIIADWARVKNDPDTARLGHRRAAQLTRLHIDRADLEALVETKLRSNDAILANRFKQWEEWPADAQLATHSMAWACGPYFPRSWPLLSAALDAQDWQAASNNCRMDEKGNPGLKPRNLVNRMLYRNAAIVVASGFTEPPHDPATLYWPRDLEDEHEEVTLPNAVPSMRPDPLEAKSFATVTRLPGSIAGDDEPPPTAA
jgi:GH24 family phage-related lysozyme (muramidase)